MNDKTKNLLADKSPAAVATNLAACGLQTDTSSARISANIISENLNNGAQGAAAITAGANGIKPNVGQCVADLYDGKKPSTIDRISESISSLTSLFSNARDSVSSAVSEMAIKPGQGPTSVTIHNSTRPPEQRL